LATGRYAGGMDSREYDILQVANLAREAAAMNDAALAAEPNEARLRAHLIAAHSDEAGHIDLAFAAAHLVIVLGPVTVPLGPVVQRRAPPWEGG
jgi:hypothetical protein